MAALDLSINAIAARVGDIGHRAFAAKVQTMDLDNYLRRARKAVLITAKERLVQLTLFSLSLSFSVSLCPSLLFPLSLSLSHSHLLSLFLSDGVPPISHYMILSLFRYPILSLNLGLS